MKSYALHLFVLLLLLVPFFSTAQSSETLLIQSVRLFDGELVQEGMDVFFEAGKVARIVPHSTDHQAEQIIDGSGKTLIPGLVNAHVHIWFPAHLQEAARAGVLTVMDMHSSSYSLPILKAFQDSTNYANYLSAGPGATVPSGHGTQFGMPTPTIDSSTSARAFTLDRVDGGSDYIKILREPSRPTINFAQIDTVIATAHEHDKLAVAHISRKKDAIRLASSHLDGFVHIWFDEVSSTEEIDTIAKGKVFMVPTIITNKRVLDYFKTQGRTNKSLNFEELKAEVKKLHEAGVTLVAGTDPPNFNINYGTDLLTEIELFVECGLSPLEALRTATGNAAKSFQLKEAGQLRENGPANAILIQGNPMENIKAIRNIEKVWKNGQLVK